MTKIVNIEPRLLHGKKIAICFGKYAPAHIGHYRTIIEAKRKADACLVIVTGEEGKDINGISFNNRFRSMRELFSDDEVISIVSLDESSFSHLKDIDYNQYLSEWCKHCRLLLEKNIEYHAEVEFSWYVHEAAADFIKANFLGSDVFISDNSINGMHTDDIIENTYKYWKYIMAPFRKYFSNNFLFFGTASTGKTNLVRDVARAINAPFTDEYARRYEYNYNVRDEELRVADLHNMGVGQFNNNRDAITSASNNGLVFADTDTMVTKCYAKEYLDPIEYHEVEQIFNYYINKQRWSLIFVIPPVTEYVNDAFRDMTHADSAYRWRMHEMFMAELKEHNLMDKVRYLNGTNFYDRYIETLDYVNAYLQEEYDSEIIY